MAATWLPDEFKLSVVRGKVCDSYLCSYISLTQPYVETIPFSFRLRDPENMMVDIAKKEITECTGRFDGDYMWQ